ncbi:cytochrome P450 6k1 isoform X2 [Amyelois transitella]|nr:cytochrome P450 6k1 isoform X2 [Amyelois transitella]
MFANLLLGVLACVLAWLFFRWRKVKLYWAIRDVAHQPPHFIWGSLTFLQQKNVGLWMKEMYSRLEYPYVGIWLFWRPALIVNCPEIGKRILSKDSEVFRDRFLRSGKTDPIGHNLFTVKDPFWSTLRNQLNPAFTQAHLRSLHSLLFRKSKQLVQRINEDNTAKKIINLRMVYADFVTDVIGTAAFGVSSDATLTGDSPMRTVTKDLMNLGPWRGMAWSSIFFFPELTDFFGFTMFPKRSTDHFTKIFQSVAKKRSVEGSDKKDLMDALLKIQQDAKKTGGEINDEVLIAQAAIFLQAGFNTTATVLTFATYELAYHLEAQEKLYKEIVELKQSLGEKDIHCDDLVNLTYMTCVINETLRKYPPMGFLDRVAATDYKIDKNLTIPAGIPIYINAIGIHYDPKYFPEPEKFKPERFLPGNVRNIQPNTFLPFGDGPRRCIGQNFGDINIRYALALILLNYLLRPLPGTPKPNDCEIEKNAIFFMPSGMMPVEFVQRNKELVF